MEQVKIEKALLNAEELSIKFGERFTEPRRQVLESLLKANSPQKAYDILANLSSGDKNVKPPTVYRALDFLVRIGIIHKIESDATYFVCSHANHCDHETHVPLFLICRKCNQVTENHIFAIEELINKSAAGSGFQLERMVVEARGMCQNCTKA